MSADLSSSVRGATKVGMADFMTILSAAAFAFARATAAAAFFSSASFA